MSAQPGRIPVSTGWRWLKEGMGLLRQQPAGLTTLLFANVLFTLMLHTIPYLGQFIAIVLIPSITMTVMQACLMVDHKQRISLPAVLTGYQKPLVVTLCKIGLIHLVVLGLLSVPGMLMIREAAQNGAKSISDFDSATTLVVMATGVLQALVGVSLFFAAPLAAWQKMPPGKALFYSFFAVWRSARVFFVMLLIWLGMILGVSMVLSLLFGKSTLAVVVMAWVGFVFILLLQCAMYASYKQIFGVPALPVRPKID